jgi:hypothetical protein
MVFEDYNFASPNFLEVESASMKKITCELGPKTPQEINAFVESKIREQEGTKLLQIEVKAEVLGDILDVRQDLSDVYPSYTLLDVNIVSPLSEKKITLERLEISQDTIREYFEKSGLVNQEELLSTCVKLFEEYGR